MMQNERSLDERIVGFSPITLREMDSVDLLNRVDTKFLLPGERLDDFLKTLTAGYRVLTLGDALHQTYQTLYFDTPDCAMYLMHHNGQQRRVKVRKRWYMGSDVAFFEIKRRNNKKRTAKSRRRLPSTEEAAAEFSAWVQKNSPYPIETLKPRTWTKFHRITLVDNALTERVTIDSHLSFKSAWGQEDTLMPTQDTGWVTPARSFCVVEVKRNGTMARPLAMAKLREYKVEPQGFSKYCVGTALLSPQLKKGCFRPLLRTLGDLVP